MHWPTEIAKDWVTLSSALIATFAFILATTTYLLNHRNAITARQPVLVFEFDQTEGWKIRNVGKGPALNVIVSIRGKNTLWKYPVTTPSLKDGNEFGLHWLGKLNTWMLGATYSDFDGKTYTTIGQHDANLLRTGHVQSEYTEPNKDYLHGSNATRHWNAVPVTDSALT
jgi:hypothetical protein